MKMFALPLAALVLTPGSAFAGQIDTAHPKVERVSARGLDLSSTAGRKQLNRRVARAVEEVCGNYGADLDADVAIDHCRANAERQVRPEMASVLASTARPGTQSGTATGK